MHTYNTNNTYTDKFTYMRLEKLVGKRDLVKEQKINCIINTIHVIHKVLAMHTTHTKNTRHGYNTYMT